MDVAPFSLGKKSNKGIIKDELKDRLITIEGGAETGLATVFDHYIFLWSPTSQRRSRTTAATKRKAATDPSVEELPAECVAYCRDPTRYRPESSLVPRLERQCLVLKKRNHALRPGIDNGSPLGSLVHDVRQCFCDDA